LALSRAIVNGEKRRYRKSKGIFPVLGKKGKHHFWADYKISRAYDKKPGTENKYRKLTMRKRTVNSIS
jgi:hypothetical protein